MKSTRSESPYRWYVLILAALTHTFVVAMPVMCMPVLFKEISEDLGLSLVQIGTIWGISSLSGIFTGLVGGSIGDRFGTKHTLSIACLLAGATGALRGLSTSFIALTVTTFLFGFLLPAIPPNVHKTCGIWFSGRRLGLANGVVSAGMALGFMVGSMISATVLSPWLGGWRNVLFLYGAISVVISIPWLLTRTAPGGAESATATTSLRRALSHVVHLRSIWFLGLVMLGTGGCLQGMLGYLPLYLREIGWAGPAADGALAAFHGISMVSTIPIALLSDRVGSRKLILVAATLMTTVGVGLLSIAEGTMVWVSVIMAGIVRDGFMAIFMTMTMETKGVGAAHAGTAMGMVLIFYRFGGLVSPPLGNSLADIGLGLPFIFWAVLAAVAFFGFYFVKEGRVGGHS
ncbi:MAG: MFS transporter [Theionarchaea archaeon]|nr:MFS transporter [Theionarchaea archaeon]